MSRSDICSQWRHASGRVDLWSSREHELWKLCVKVSSVSIACVLLVACTDEAQEAVNGTHILASLCDALRFFKGIPRVVEAATLAIGNLCLLMRMFPPVPCLQPVRAAPVLHVQLRTRLTPVSTVRAWHCAESSRKTLQTMTLFLLCVLHWLTFSAMVR